MREHTRLGELARHWDEQKRSRGATLRGADLDAAERWLDRRPADANAPTDLHQDLIRASRRAATMRQRYWVGGSLAVAIVAIGLAVFAEISRREAQKERDRAERTLALATSTANGLVFNLAQKIRDVVGEPASTMKDILDRSRQLQEQLYSSGESTPALRYSQGAALDEVAKTLLTLGDTKSALDTAKQSARSYRTSWRRTRQHGSQAGSVLVLRYDGQRAGCRGRLAGRAQVVSGGPRLIEKLWRNRTQSRRTGKIDCRSLTRTPGMC